MNCHPKYSGQTVVLLVASLWLAVVPSLPARQDTNSIEPRRTAAGNQRFDPATAPPDRKNPFTEQVRRAMADSATDPLGPEQSRLNAIRALSVFRDESKSDGLADMRVVVAWDGINRSQTLPDATVVSVPAGEVARQFCGVFSNGFDVILPNTAGEQAQGPKWRVTLKLKEVRAVEIFNAMNLIFEAEKSPLHWRLTLNGDRPAAVLQVLDSALKRSQAPQIAKVIFIGDIISDADGKVVLAPDQLGHTISDALEEAFPNNDLHLALHKDSDLLVVKGDADQIAFVESTLAALKSRVSFNKMISVNARIQKEKEESRTEHLKTNSLNK